MTEKKFANIIKVEKENCEIINELEVNKIHK